MACSEEVVFAFKKLDNEDSGRVFKHGKMTEPRVESLYSNIDPATGRVANVSGTQTRSTTDYVRVSSPEYTPRHVGCDEWTSPRSFKSKIQHMLTFDFLFKLLENILLAMCCSLFQVSTYRMLNILGLVIFPCSIFVSVLIITFCITVCHIFKMRMTNLFSVIFHMLATLLVSISGGVVFGVWIRSPMDKTAMIQAIISFAAALIFLADLALNLEHFNKNTKWR